jgi:hypothetical protein
MNQSRLFLGIIFLLLSILACSQFPGEESTVLPPTAIASPTLAPTATLDPNFTPPPPPTSDATAVVTPVPDESLVSPKAIDDTPSATGPGSGGSSGDSGGGGDSSGDGNGGSGNGSGDGGGNGDGGGSSSGGSTAACPASGTNLLSNPSFEGEFKPFGSITELNHAPNWFPWWKDGENNLRPEYKPAGVDVAPNRVHSGSTAQQYFKSFGQFKAGLSQSVLNLPIGTRLQFSAHGQAWSCIEFSKCSNGTSFEPANMLMRVGIDPFGGTDPFSGDIKWSAYFNPLDHWEIACVEAVAESAIITVYVWASPDGPRQNQDIYWDDATLISLP